MRLTKPAIDKPRYFKVKGLKLLLNGLILTAVTKKNADFFEGTLNVGL